MARAAAAAAGPESGDVSLKSTAAAAAAAAAEEEEEEAEEEEEEAEAEEEEEVRQALAAAQLVEVTVAAGGMEEVELRVSERTHMYVSVDVAKGRDVDFGMMLVQPGVDGADDPPAPSRLFGPCHRATNLSANVLVPHAGTVVLGFDNSGSWVREKRVHFRVRLGDGSGRGATLL